MATRLLVLYTGGTIGMDHTPAGLAPVPGLLPKLLDRFRRDDLTIDVVEYPELIDSSAITVAHWNRLIDDIATNYAAYDGFVVIHGTDTMAYTASVLAFALHGLNKPVVLTGSQLPLVHPRSDGWSNLADALEAAAQPSLCEVVLAFNRQLLRGVTARKLDAASFAGFESPNAEPLAEFGIDVAWYRDRWCQPRGEFAPVRLDESAEVLLFMLAPGATAAQIGRTLAERKPAGAVLLSYGNGNAPADPALLDGVRVASAAGSLILNLTQVVHGRVAVGAYAASQPLAQAGALPGADMTPEAAIAKLTVLASQRLELALARALLEKSLVGEFND
ncbi:asparaginase [Crenobacter sp. SG2305]|uniref:asparaginase n=1 Tax=Crenobacter oryzisoli TaxID=3056844 RepID=UPI0025AAF5D4|nr:asparaginase [Crenobacter sp. SG2305]MDN0081858.1 asparaginase [Crenobacter sp. SG2305]